MMTFEMGHASVNQPGAAGCESKRGVVLSLPVVQSMHVGGHGTKIRRSRASWWRAGALILLNVLMAAHVVVWWFSGMRDGVRETLSPIEPSESMYTIETGVLNAGFLFFISAIVVTLVFGRFVCGWGCHIVSLQDLCSWLMEKVGLRPRAWRSRLLMLAPLALALYMFVWPTFRRVVLQDLIVGRERWASFAPWLGETHDFQGWLSGLFVEDFWKTFPP